MGMFLQFESHTRRVISDQAEGHTSAARVALEHDCGRVRIRWKIRGLYHAMHQVSGLVAGLVAKVAR
jgi:hypothetical protein